MKLLELLHSLNIITRRFFTFNLLSIFACYENILFSIHGDSFTAHLAL